MRIIFFIALRYLKGANRFMSRSNLLAFWGICISISLFVIVISIFNGFQRQIKQAFFETGSHISISFIDNRGLSSWRDTIKKLESLLAEEKVLRIEGVINNPALFKNRQQLDYILLSGVENLHDDSLTKRHPLLNFVTSPVKLQYLPRGAYCLVGSEMVLAYGLTIGDDIHIIAPKGQFTLNEGVEPNMMKFRIGGILNTGNYEYDSRAVIISLEQAQNLFGLRGLVSEIALQFEKIHELSRIKTVITSALGHSIYRILTVEEAQTSLFSALKIEKVIMSIIMFLFIVLAALLMGFTTSNLIRNKYQDIGILKALGLSNKQIFSIFILNSFLISTIGTSLGVLLGVTCALYINGIIAGVEYIINLIGFLFYNTNWYVVELLPKDIYYFDKIPTYLNSSFLIFFIIGAYVLIFLSILIPTLLLSKLDSIKIIRDGERQ